MESPTLEKSTTSERRLPSLDGWRAVAIGLVLFSHLPYTLGFPAARWAFAEQFFDGNFGVRIFFTLSGFIITWLLLREEKAAGTVSLKRFYARRCLRIFPIYFSYLAVLATLSVCGKYHDAASSWLGALTFTRNILGRGGSATVHLWSLAIEEQFYICWPVAFKLFKLGRRSKTAMVSLGIIILLANVARWYVGFFPDNLQSDQWLGARALFRYADCLAIGCLGAFVRSQNLWRPAFLYRSLALIAVVSGVLLDRFYLDQFFSYAWMVPTVQGLGFGYLMLESIESPQWYKILNQPWVIYIGAISYSLYIWHILFLYHFAPDVMPAWLQRWDVWIFPSFLAGALSYRWIERPFLTLKSKWTWAKAAKDRPSARSPIS